MGKANFNMKTETSATLDVLALYDTHQSRIFHYVLHRTGDVEVARDITAEVFFKVHKHRWRFKLTSAPVSAWLFRIAGNEVSSFLRKQKYRPICLDAALEKSEAVPLSLRGDLREEMQRLQAKVELNATFFRVHQKLVGLPNKYQEVIVLRYLEEKTILEIAEILGKKEGTVKSLISRGLARLRRVVGRDGTRAPTLLADVSREKGVNA